MELLLIYALVSQSPKTDPDNANSVSELFLTTSNALSGGKKITSLSFFSISGLVFVVHDLGGSIHFGSVYDVPLTSRQSR